MCGICGMSTADPRGLLALPPMQDTLRHRGPDDEGIWTDPALGVGLAHRRLSIVDLSPLGRNPMSRNGRLWITYNGEVYNFMELRRELEGLGESFRSRTDTEVILAAYDRWGIECLARFIGMFAFGLWDARARRLFLARDRLGKKPLYYAEYAGRFAFASELKALLADPDFPRDIDPQALDLYLRFGYVPSPFSIFRAARKLPPAHLALWDPAARSLKVERYWDPVAFAAAGPVPISEREAEEKLEALLADAVRLRMIADVPLGAFLSGGVDSSLVVAMMKEVSASPVKTFTIRFENPEYNEADHAAAVARHLGTEHHEETCSAPAMLDIVATMARHMDEPFADSSLIPTYVVSRMTRRHVTVALSGDGGDELFFGYPRFWFSAYLRWLLEAPRGMRNLLAGAVSRIPRRWFRRAADVLRQEDADGYRRFVTYWADGDAERMTGRRSSSYETYDDVTRRLSSLTPQLRLPVLDLVTYLPEDILTKVDRASMAVGLEARPPLLDHRLVEFAVRLPLDLKWRMGTSKWLLRRMLYKRVPRELLERPKMGFGVPLADWFRGPLRAAFEERLAGDGLAALGLDPSPARLLWSDFKARKSNRTDLLWSLHALLSWSEHSSKAPRPAVSAVA
jgi:asparagine synthase (glutamine-hydrolysing)